MVKEAYQLPPFIRDIAELDAYQLFSYSGNTVKFTSTKGVEHRGRIGDWGTVRPPTVPDKRPFNDHITGKDRTTRSKDVNRSTLKVLSQS